MVSTLRSGWLRRGRLLALALVALTFQSAWHAACGEEPRALPRRSPTAAGCDRASFRVAIDVGHTATVPGAMSARGVPEYEFNLRLAKLIVRKLIEDGFRKTVLLITAGPARPSLFERVSHANRVSADLLLSIHHDSVPNQFKQAWEYEGKRNHYCDAFKGHSIFISNENVARDASLQFARLLGKGLKARGLQYTPHYTQAFMGRFRRELLDAEAGVYRYDQLIVLRTTRMPAVLLEAGSIVNRDEELKLAAPERQLLIGAAVTEAVEKFCASQPPSNRGTLAHGPATAPAGQATIRPVVQSR
jgi:N-acetylmuramoyl-L-alanine amidase